MTLKKVLFFFILMLLPIVTRAKTVEIEGIYYELFSEIEEATVESNPNYYTGNVVIPASVSYEGAEYSVTSIGSFNFHFFFVPLQPKSHFNRYYATIHLHTRPC